MKKVSAIIFAIFMIVASMPFAIAADSYEITHQPTVNEPYVEANDENAAYQWYEVTEGYIIDNTTATPFDPDILGFYEEFVGYAYYREDMGWVPTYYTLPNGVYSMYYFTVSLKAGETATFEFSTTAINASVLYDDALSTVRILLEGNMAAFTADKDGRYSLVVDGRDFVTVNASADGKVYTAIEGEDSARLNTPEAGKKYVCYVTFSDGTVAVSDEVSGHDHTGTELVCMGYICSVCGAYFGEETADVHSFTSYTRTIAPTCAEKGAEEAVCDYGCGTTDVKEIPETNHEGTLVQKDGKAATCTQAGYEAYEYCTECDYTTYKEIPAAHTPREEVREYAVVPDCKNEGVYDLVVYCGECDEELVRITISASAVDHKDADGDYMCDFGCGYEFEKPDEPTPDEPTPDEPTPDEPTPDEPTPDEPTPDEPSEDEVCDKCGKVHNGLFDNFVCFFIMIFNAFVNIFA